jgi:hypothetical protein
VVIKTIQQMMYNAKVAVCSEIPGKHLKQSDHYVEFFNVKPGGKYRNSQDCKG